MTEYRNRKLSEFLSLYDTTTLTVDEIFERIDVCRSNRTAQFIRHTLRRMTNDPKSDRYNGQYRRVSKKRNRNGLFRVNKQRCDGCEQGYLWTYRTKVNGKFVTLASKDLETLKQKVLDKGWAWIDFKENEKW